MNPLLEFLHQNFSLPDGGLYSNLIASALLGAGGFVYGRAFEKRAIQRHHIQLAQKERHQRELVLHLKKIHKHLEED